MREVRLAKTAGFCFGVKRAVDTVYNQVTDDANIKVYTYGPIIHNEEVVLDLEKKGVIILDDNSDLDSVRKVIDSSDDTDIEKVRERADEMMYQNKKKLKER